MKEIGKATQSPQPPHEAEVINKPESKSGDVAPAGLPSRTMRSIASQYKRESLTSNFKLTGKHIDERECIKLNDILVALHRFFCNLAYNSRQTSKLSTIFLDMKKNAGKTKQHKSSELARS